MQLELFAWHSLSLGVLAFPDLQEPELSRAVPQQVLVPFPSAAEVTESSSKQGENGDAGKANPR